MSVTNKTIFEAFTDEVTQSIRKVSDVQDKAYRSSDKDAYSLRSNTPAWGAYWFARKISGELSYTEARDLEEAMDEFVDKYCRALTVVEFDKDEGYND